MALRMMLVSLVASLGLSLPSSAELDRWTRSTRCWLDTQRAAWDARMPTDTRAFVYFDENESVNLPAQVAANPPIASETTASPSTSASLPFDSVFAEGAPAVVFALPPMKVEPAVVVSDQEFETLMDEVAATFSADLDLRAAELPTTAIAEVEPTTPDAPRFDDTFAESMGSLFQTETDSLLIARRDVTSANEPVSSLETVHDESGQENSGVVANDHAGVTTADPAIARPAAADRVSLAFKLTRDAALAWASLLHAPAVVTIGR